MRRNKVDLRSRTWGWFGGFEGMLACIMFVGLVLRLLALRSWAQTPYWSIPIIDEAYYHDWATALATSQPTSGTAYEFAPLPAFLFATLYRVFGVSLLVVRLANILMSTTSIYMIAILARRVGGDQSGLIAGALSACYMPFIFYSVTLLKTTFSVFMFSIFMLCLVNSVTSRNTMWCLLLGFLGALCLNTRGNYIVLLPIGLLAAAVANKELMCSSADRWKRTLIYAVGALLALAPFTVRNALVSGEFVLSTTQGGFNFYLGNHHLYSTPYCRPTQFATPSPSEQGVQFTVEASRRSGKLLSAAMASTFWYQEALSEMAAQPMFSLEKTGKKVLAVCNRREACDHFSITHLSKLADFLRLPFPMFGLIFPFAVAGIAVRLKDQKSQWLLLPLVLYAVTLVLFFTTGRYRLPLLVILIPYTAMGLFDLVTALRANAYKTLGIFCVVLVLAFAFESIPLQGSTDFSAYHNAQGVVLDMLGRKKEAVDCWKNSIACGGNYVPSACIELAKAECREGHLDTAEEYLTLIPDRSYAQASKLAMLAQIRVIQNRMSEAAELLQQSLAINAGDLRVREFLTNVLQLTDPPAAQRERQVQERIQTFYK